MLGRRERKPHLEVERFERIDAGEEMVLLRLTLTARPKSGLESPLLTVVVSGEETELVPLPAPGSSGGVEQGVWRRAFGATTELVAHESASYSLRGEDGIELELPRPVDRREELERLGARLEVAENREREAAEAAEGAAARVEEHSAGARAAEARSAELEEALQSSERQLEEERARIAELETTLREGEGQIETADRRLAQQAELLEATRSGLTEVHEVIGARVAELSDVTGTLEPGQQDSEPSTQP